MILILGSVIAGYDIIAGAVLSVLDGKFLDKTVLILLSALIAFVFGAIVEGAALVLLFQLGGIFIATRRAHRMTALAP